MKKTLLYLILLICIASKAQIPANAGKENKAVSDQITPPPVIKEKFTKEYPGITPSWNMDGKNFRAEFVDPNTFKGNSIVYDKDGAVIRRENEMENSSYPNTINDYFIKHFPGEKFKTWTSQDPAGQKTYYIKRNSEVVWFDKDGNYIQPSK